MCSHLQLQAVWEEMRGALQGWLAEGALPGGLASLDKASYEQAMATYAVLQEAAAKGAEFLEQVWLANLVIAMVLFMCLAAGAGVLARLIAGYVASLGRLYLDLQ